MSGFSDSTIAPSAVISQRETAIPAARTPLIARVTSAG